MTEQEEKRLACELSALSVFRGILKYDTMSAFIGLLSTDGGKQEKLRLFGEFVYSLSEDNYCFSDFLCRAVFSDENRYIISAAQKTEIPQSLRYNAKRELEIFSRLTELDENDLCKNLSFDGHIPQFDNKKTDFVKIYE